MLEMFQKRRFARVKKGLKILGALRPELRGAHILTNTNVFPQLSNAEAELRNKCRLLEDSQQLGSGKWNGTGLTATAGGAAANGGPVTEFGSLSPDDYRSLDVLRDEVRPKCILIALDLTPADRRDLVCVDNVTRRDPLWRTFFHVNRVTRKLHNF